MTDELYDVNDIEPAQMFLAAEILRRVAAKLRARDIPDLPHDLELVALFVQRAGRLFE